MYAETDILAEAAAGTLTGNAAGRPSDRELLERTRAHDEAAFEALVERHQDLLINYATRMIGCRSQAEDVVQETFVRFFRSLDRYREQGNLKAFLLRIVTNLVVSRERRRKRWRLLLPAFSGAEVARTEPSPQALALLSEAHRQLLTSIQTLDPRYRAPLIMREIEGLTYQEIALALRVSEGTVKSRLHRARALVKQALSPYLGGNPR